MRIAAKFAVRIVTVKMTVKMTVSRNVTVAIVVIVETAVLAIRTLKTSRISGFLMFV